MESIFSGNANRDRESNMRSSTGKAIPSVQLLRYNRHFGTFVRNRITILWITYLGLYIGTNPFTSKICDRQYKSTVIFIYVFHWLNVTKAVAPCYGTTLRIFEVWDDFWLFIWILEPIHDIVVQSACCCTDRWMFRCKGKLNKSPYWFNNRTIEEWVASPECNLLLWVQS